MTHWEAKAEPSITYRNVDTSGGTLVNTTEDDDEEPFVPQSSIVRSVLKGMEDREEVTELTDIPEPTFSDPDAKTIEVRDPELPKSDHTPGPYNLDPWYEGPYKTGRLDPSIYP